MNREQYLKYLIDKGFSNAVIIEKMNEWDKQNSPKKTQDPVKTETSMGSLTDMVSKSEDGSLELSKTDIESFVPFAAPKKEELISFGDKVSIMGKDVTDNYNRILKRKTDIDYTEEESRAIKLKEDWDAGIIGDKFDKLKIVDQEVEEAFSDDPDFTDKATSVWNATLSNISRFTMGQADLSSIRGYTTKEEYLKKAANKLAKNNKQANPKEVLSLAKELYRQDVTESETEKAWADFVSGLNKSSGQQFVDNYKNWLTTWGAVDVENMATPDERQKLLYAAQEVEKKQNKHVNNYIKKVEEIGWEGQVIEILDKESSGDFKNLSDEQKSDYISSVRSINEKIVELQDNFNNIQSDYENVGTFTDELNALSKHYDVLTRTITPFASGTAGLTGGLFNVAELGVDLLSRASRGWDISKEEESKLKEQGLFGTIGDQFLNVSRGLSEDVYALDFNKLNKPSDYFEYFTNALLQNSPQMVVTIGSGFNPASLHVLSGSAGGQKYSELLKEDKATSKEYNLDQLFVASAAAYATEYVSERFFEYPALKRLMPGARVANAAKKEMSKEALDQVSALTKKQALKNISKELFAGTGGFVANSSRDGLGESLVQLEDNLMHRFVLDDTSRGIFDGIDEAFAVGAVIAGTYGAPGLVGTIQAPFVKDKKIKKNFNEINNLINRYYNIDPAKADGRKQRRLIEEQIEKKKLENAGIMLGSIRPIYGLGKDDIEEAVNISEQMRQVQIDYKQIFKSKDIAESEKKNELEYLTEKYKELSQRQNELIKKGNDNVDRFDTYSKKINIDLKRFGLAGNVNIIEAKTTNEAKQTAEKFKSSFEGSGIEVEEAPLLNGYIISNPQTGEHTVIVNKEVALRSGNTNVVGHELLHAALYATLLKGGAVSKALANSLKEKINEIDPKLLEEGEFKERLEEYNTQQEKDNETLTLFFDAIAEGHIKLNETAASNIGNKVRRVLQEVGFNIKFDTADDVLNFVKDFNNSVDRGRLTAAQAKLFQQGAKGKIVESAQPLSEEEAAEQANEELQFAASKVATNTGKPKAIFMIGGAGSGKSNIVNMLNLGWKQVNEDLATEPLKKEAGLPESEADYTSEQLSQRAKIGAQARKQAKEKLAKYTAAKENMIIDGTGASYNATTKKMQALRDAGYDVSIIYAKTSLDVAKQRNKDRKERSLREDIVERNHADVNANIEKYKNDLGDNFFEINTDQIEYAQPLPRDFMNKVNKGIGQTVSASKPKDSVLETINKLVPQDITTKEDFQSNRSFYNIYNEIANDGGVINNYIKSRTSSQIEAELAIDSVKDRLLSFDPKSKRKDGSTVGIEGFGEFIFANTAFGKLDAKKKLYEESQRKAKETSIDESTKQIADTETTVEEVAVEKERPTINPLKFTGAPAEITLSEKPGKGLTFKKVGKQYAGEVGEQIIGVPAKKITEAAANLGSVNEARAIQQFFFKADNLEKFLKILPETNIALPQTKVGLETLEVPRDVNGTGLGLPKRILDYFYEDYIDATGKITSPKGRSKGLTSQVPVKRLKPEFRGIISIDTINKVKKDLGITPRGELNILPKGELRSPIGQLLKGMTKVYSTLAANTLVRQELQKAGATKQEVAAVAGGKKDIMASKRKPSEIAAKAKEDMLKTRVLEDLIVTTLNITRKQARKLMDISANIKDSDDEKAIYDRNKKLPEDMATFEGETVIQGVSRVLNDFLKQNPRFHEMLRISSTFGLDRAIFATQEGWAKNIKIDTKKLREQNQVSTGNYSYTKKKLIDKNYLKESKNPGFVESEFKRFDDMIDFFEAVNIYLKKEIEDGKKSSLWAFQEVIRQATNSQKHFSRSSFPRLVYEVDLKTGRPIIDVKGVEEHFTPQNLVATLLLGGIKNGYLKEAIDIAKAVSMQGFISKELDDMVNVKYKTTPPDILLDRLEDIITGKLKLDQGLASIIRYTESDIDLNRLFYVPANKTLGEYFFGNKSVPVKVQKEMMRKLFSGDTTLDLMRKYGEQYEKTTVEEAKVVQSNNKLVSVMASKSNKQVINNLNNYDKALRNARDPKAPIKGISVFDFDDTLATTKSMVGVTMPDGTEIKIDATEFAKNGEDLLEQGATFDFSDFSKVVGGEPGPLISKLDKAIKKFGSKDVFILTARPANSASAIHEFLKGLGYEIPLENITGLANSSPEAKAQWMVDKAAEGYNDFYFTDDAYKNVKAVQDAMSVLDVKSKERIVYKDRFEKLDKEFNDILENKTGIASEKEYSDAKAEVIGVDKGKFNFFISPSAEDFVGLLYSTLGKGKLGENQMAWYKKNLLDPYTRAMNNIASERMALAADYKALKKQLGVVPNKLRNKIKGEGFTQEQAVRIYIWNKQGMDVPGLSKTDLAEMTKYVQNNPKLQVFADQLIDITKGDGYAMPFENWMTGSITTDLLSTLQVTKRAKHLEEWQRNVDVIFSKKNLNKLEAAYGSTYRGAMENILQRMKTGKNRGYDTDSLTGRFLDWVNGSTGAIMFFNTRSAVLQTISAINFINWSDNNIFKASAAFANQKQYWKDFKELFMSDFLKERRDNLTININESDIAEMANKGGVRGAIGYILQKGFLPTQFADGFAIASGGATFYRNRINTYMKEGLSEKEAKEKAFNDFRELTEESQQSSRPDRISQQQAGPLGRIVLAFANTPSQYARIIKKAALDLKNNRGDWKTNLSKIMYYSVIQGVIFNALQSALFAADFDDEEEMEEKMFKMGNSITDGILRGMGAQGAITSVVKNTTLKALEESEKSKPKYDKVVNEILRISPPVSSKISKLQQAAREIEWNKKEMKSMGWSLENPAWIASANVLSATTNIPADRVIKKINNITYATTQDLELYERLALLGGWQKWELGIKDGDKKEKQNTNPRFRSTSGRLRIGSEGRDRR